MWAQIFLAHTSCTDNTDWLSKYWCTCACTCLRNLFPKCTFLLRKNRAVSYISACQCRKFPTNLTQRNDRFWNILCFVYVYKCICSTIRNRSRCPYPIYEADFLPWKIGWFRIDKCNAGNTVHVNFWIDGLSAKEHAISGLNDWLSKKLFLDWWNAWFPF